MALIKTYTTPSNTTGNYWRLAPTIEINVNNKMVDFTVECYTDKQTRLDGGKRMAYKKYRTMVDDINGNIRQQIYAKLPTLKNLGESVAFFSGATSDE